MATVIFLTFRNPCFTCFAKKKSFFKTLEIMFFKLFSGHAPTSLKAGPPSSDNFQIPLQQVLDLSGRPPGPRTFRLLEDYHCFVTLIAIENQSLILHRHLPIYIHKILQVGITSASWHKKRILHVTHILTTSNLSHDL